MFKKPFLLAYFLLILDQCVKIYIKTHFFLGESVEVFSGFQILFIENEGAAWGAKLSDILPISDVSGKIALTVFRLFAIVGIGAWFVSSVKKGVPLFLQMAQALIFAGALGNIIDSVFYGVLFNDSMYQVATLFSDQPYGSLLQGKVVDMLYFPLIDTTWPEWVPVLGGNSLRFFEPVFNIADTAISTGVGFLLVFNKKAFPQG
ncbi:lipoprotein signal peptidase [Flavobacteriaceae bacterium]|nr:lipoprotein signal peptidase [Flavobacteriaceae bacterium]